LNYGERSKENPASFQFLRVAQIAVGFPNSATWTGCRYNTDFAHLLTATSNPCNHR
jgi:hypothetical protein